MTGMLSPRQQINNYVILHSGVHFCLTRGMWDGPFGGFARTRTASFPAVVLDLSHKTRQMLAVCLVSAGETLEPERQRWREKAPRLS